jgi:pseudouridine-5'-monophosphatase
MTSAAPPARGVIFDMDGLLLDTEPLYFKASSTVVAEFGHEFTRAHRREIIGTGARSAAEFMLRTFGLPITADEFLERRDKIIQQLFPTCEARPGAKELSGHLVRWCVDLCFFFFFFFFFFF